MARGGLYAGCWLLEVCGWFDYGWLVMAGLGVVDFHCGIREQPFLLSLCFVFCARLLFTLEAAASASFSQAFSFLLFIFLVVAFFFFVASKKSRKKKRKKEEKKEAQKGMSREVMTKQEKKQKKKKRRRRKRQKRSSEEKKRARKAEAGHAGERVKKG